VAAAHARGEIVIGFRLEGDGPDAAVVNPAKSGSFVLGVEDQVVIVVSERAGTAAGPGAASAAEVSPTGA
jgi:hypothetical protein